MMQVKCYTILVTLINRRIEFLSRPAGQSNTRSKKGLENTGDSFKKRFRLCAFAVYLF